MHIAAGLSPEERQLATLVLDARRERYMLQQMQE
jgi:hypothetical protein